MNYKFLYILFLISFLGSAKIYAAAPPDTVKVGIYITSVHDIDFKQKEYSIILWLWLEYKNPEFDFLKNLELPQAKTFSKSYSTLDTINGKIHILMKLQCVMKDSWRISNFPFDNQKLRLTIENSEFDSRFLVFEADTVGKHFDPKFTLSGWDIDSFRITTGIKAYETAFGDTSLSQPHSEYSTFKVVFGIKRHAWGLFWKMFLGMYVSFLIAFVCFFIHAKSIESRFGLSVGALFAAIGNKYVIDSSLPESTSFTLVDSLHGLTLIFIFAVITSSVYALKLIKGNKVKEANRFDVVIALVLLIAYVTLNVYYISSAL
jgi:hypothetical protein